MGGQNAGPAAAGDYLVKGNLFVRTVTDHRLSLQTNNVFSSDSATAPGSVRMDNIQVLNNTWYTPFKMQTFTFGVEPGTGGFGGVNRVAGNIWTRGTPVSGPPWVGTEGATLSAFPCNGGPCTSEQWEKNFILGFTRALPIILPDRY